MIVPNSHAAVRQPSTFAEANPNRGSAGLFAANKVSKSKRAASTAHRTLAAYHTKKAATAATVGNVASQTKHLAKAATHAKAATKLLKPKKPKA